MGHNWYASNPNSGGNSMRVIVPKPITLVSSNVPEEDYPVWDENTTYNAGDIVLVEGLGDNSITKKYQSIEDNNTGNYPPKAVDKWQDLGATNRWAMFDEYTTTQTENDNSIDVTFTCNKISHIALFNIEATHATIEVYDPENDSLIKSYDINLRLDRSTSWSDYFFGDFYYRTAYIQTIPFSFEDVKVRVVLDGLSRVKCGLLVAGRYHYIGCTYWGLRTGILDFSKKEIDKFGITYLSEGPWSKRAEFDVEIPNGSVGKVQKLLADLRATPCVWDANNDDTDYDNLIIYGFYKDFDIILRGAVVSKCTITIEGLI